MATQPSSRTAEKPRGESGNGPGRGWPEKNGGLRGGQSLTSSSQDIHRSPPHSVEAEQGVLGSLLISPREAIGECVEKINEEYFYVPAHQTISNVLVNLWNAGQAIDLITFTQVLRDRNLLETVGGAALVTSLFTFVPTAANLGYYLEIVRDKYILRSIIAAGTESVRRAYAATPAENVSDIVAEFESRAASLQSIHGRNGADLPTPTSIVALAATDPAIFDADNLLGKRFLCVEGGMLFVGPSGIGKSSANVQQDILWSLGRSAFGIRPARPLRILCVQAENDDGDLAEM